jgi:hypothetical protein
MIDTEDLRRRLERLTETPGPPQRADLTRARREGDRAIRNRRVLMAAGSAAAAGTLILGVAVALPGSNAVPVRPVSTQPNPLIKRASFGWLPPGYKVTSTASGSWSGNGWSGWSGFGITATGPAPIELMVGISGPQATQVNQPGSSDPSFTVPAPAVNGHRAFWSSKPGSRAYLRWQYAPGSWALLHAFDLGSKPSEVFRSMYRIAESARLDGTEPAAFPARIIGIPAALRIIKAEVGTPAYVNLAFHTGPGAGYEESGSLGISVDPPDPHDRPNTVIAGYPVYDDRLVRQPSKDVRLHTVVVYGPGGHILAISFGPRALDALKSAGGLAGLISRVTFLEPGHWTTSPLG